jgi:hypothetical protein
MLILIMSDIRLKTITIEPNTNLLIQNGNVNISNTTISSNVLNGAFLSYGGIAINCTYDSTSSTSGGAITIGGGTAIHGQTFLGNNLILDNNSSILRVNGISDNRLFLDSVSNKHFYIALDGINKRFDLNDTFLSINISTNSINASTGALIVNGGISINNTLDSQSYTNGGALTINGGLSVAKNVFLGSSLNINQNLLVNGIINIGNNTTFTKTGNDLGISNIANINFTSTSNGNFTFNNNTNSIFTINGQNYSTFYKYLLINDTIESLNLSTGSLVIAGGLSIKCTTDSTSFTQGGGMSLAGGLAISKKTFTGDSLGIELSNSFKANKLMLYQNSSDLTATNSFTGLGITSGSLRFQLNSNTSDYIFYSATSNTSSNEVFRIKGSNEIQFIGNLQRYSIKAGGNTVNDISFQSQNIATASSVNFFTADGDSNDNNDLKVFGLGLPNSVINSEYLKLGWNYLNTNYIISTNNTGTGALRNLILQTNNNTNQLQLNTNGTINLSSTINSANSSSGALILNSISVTSNASATSLTNGGAITVNGGLSISKNMFIGTHLNISTDTNGNSISLYSKNTAGDLVLSNPSANFIFTPNASSNTSSLTLYSLNSTAGNQSLSLNYNGINNNINSNATGTGVLSALQLNVNSFTQLFLSTNGNIGINTTLPSFGLDINTNMQANNYNHLNQLTIYNTNDASNVSSSGSLTVLGGTSIAKQLFVGGPVSFTNTMGSSSTSAALYISGGLTVVSGQNSNFGSGALTVLGGGYFGGEVYIQQNLNVMGTISGSASSSSTFAYLTLTATDQSINLTSGSLVTFGGITIQAQANSVSVSNGGALLTGGGASIGKDLYIGGNLFNYGTSNYFANQNNLINFYDLSNIQRFSLNRDTVSNDFSISRYSNTGTFVEKSISISNSTGIITLSNTMASLNPTSGSLITPGGITINNTVNSTSTLNGGALTVYGGTSISKNLFVGGDTLFTSTTISTNVSTGSVIMYGGLGISGNLNVLGNTILNGNLTVVGGTTSIASTNTLLTDNIIILNSGPSGTKDSGFIIQRFQQDNDTGTGDTVNDPPSTNDTLPNQSGMTSTQIKLSTNTSSIDDYYKGLWIKITSGFSNNQVRKIIGYIASTRIATLDAAWTTQNPALGDTVSLYNKPYVGLLFSENQKSFVFGSTVQDPGSNSVVFTDTLPIKFSSALSVSTNLSTSITSGAIVLTGGLSISNTTDATSLSSGNALTVGGGVSIGKSAYIGSNLYISGVNVTPNINDVPSTVLFNASNNTTNGNFITINNNVTGFNIYIAVILIAGSNLYSNYSIIGVNKTTSWQIITNYVGDNILSFNITNTGQLQYTTINYTGFTSLQFKYKIITN